jgi:hypothetical protein
MSEVKTPITSACIWRHIDEQNSLKDKPVSFDRLAELTVQNYTEIAELAKQLERDRARLIEALRKIDMLARSHPYAGSTCGDLARAILSEMEK